MSTWVPLCRDCRVPVRDGVQASTPPRTDPDPPSGQVTCRYCGTSMDVDEDTKWVRVA